MAPQPQAQAGQAVRVLLFREKPIGWPRVVLYNRVGSSFVCSMYPTIYCSRVKLGYGVKVRTLISNSSLSWWARWRDICIGNNVKQLCPVTSAQHHAFANPSIPPSAWFVPRYSEVLAYQGPAWQWQRQYLWASLTLFPQPPKSQFSPRIDTRILGNEKLIVVLCCPAVWDSPVS